LAFRAARATVSVRRALEQGFTTLRDMETEGAGYGDVGIKQAIEGGYIPGPALVCFDARDLDDGGYPLEGYAPEIEVPKGCRSSTGRSKRARPRASNSTTAPTGSRCT
jgi:hypothetical protein